MCSLTKLCQPSREAKGLNYWELRGILSTATGDSMQLNDTLCYLKKMQYAVYFHSAGVEFCGVRQRLIKI